MSWLSKGLKKIKKVIDKTDPTGVTGDIMTGGVVKGGHARNLIGKASSKDGGKSKSKTSKSRYKRRKRNRWKSKRTIAFEGKQKLLTAGIDKK